MFERLSEAADHQKFDEFASDIVPDVDEMEDRGTQADSAKSPDQGDLEWFDNIEEMEFEVEDNIDNLKQMADSLKMKIV